MNELIIGGIYLTQNNNYLVVVCLNEENDDWVAHYLVALFNKDNFTQHHLALKKDILENDCVFCAINEDDTNLPLFFNNGYCGKVKKELLIKLTKEFKKYTEYHRYLTIFIDENIGKE